MADASSTTTEVAGGTSAIRWNRTRPTHLLVRRAQSIRAEGLPGAKNQRHCWGRRSAHGTVYTYFEDKAGVFKAVVVELTVQLDRGKWRISLQLSDPVDRIAGEPELPRQLHRAFAAARGRRNRLARRRSRVPTVARQLSPALRRTRGRWNPGAFRKTGWSTANWTPTWLDLRCARWSKDSAVRGSSAVSAMMTPKLCPTP